MAYAIWVGNSGERVTLFGGDDGKATRAVFAVFAAAFFGIAALAPLVRNELVLTSTYLEFRSMRGIRRHRWSEFSDFRSGGGGRAPAYLNCVYAGQADRPWLLRRGLFIFAPLGLPKFALAQLLTDWRKRAIAREDAASPADAIAQIPASNSSKSLLDYAPKSWSDPI